MEDYKVHTVSYYPFNTDVVSGMLWSLEIEGITEEDNCLKMYSKKSSGVMSNDVEKLLRSLVEQNLIEKYEVIEGIEKQQNWNEYWESKLNIIRITDKIIIKPTSKNYSPGKDEIVIVIDPKMSFGTGEHETTKLCISAVEKHVKQGDTILDLGSGTGILAIIASKLGAKKAYAVDNDEWCLENGKENVTLNSAGQNVDVILGDITTITESNFDVIIANINKNVLTNLGAGISQKISEAGKLIISGFYVNDLEELTNYYSTYNFKKLEHSKLNNWCSIIFEKI